jgi:macrolide transport system ATP-binding/permease protein
MRSAVPRLVLWLFALAAPASARDSLLADLEEEAAARALRDGPRSARRWCWRQLAGSFSPLAFQRLYLTLHVFGRSTMLFWRRLPYDLALAIRRLAQSPGFTVTCVLTLALGIGATTAMFTLIQQVLLQPLPVLRPAELYRLGDDDNCCVVSGLQRAQSLYSYDLYRHLRDHTPEFVDMAAFQAGGPPLNVRRPGAATAEAFAGEMVSGNYFATLAVAAIRGRVLEPADDRPGVAASAVISYRAWEHRFGSDPAIVGQTVSVNGVPATIVGVTPEGFYGDALRPNPPEIWLPIASEPLLQPEGRLVATPTSHWLYVIGRARPARRADQIAPRVTMLLRQWLTALPDLATRDRERIPDQVIRVVPASTGVNNMRHDLAPALLILLAISSAVLVIACANLANLLLARGLGRRVEFAVRTALGAARGRLLAESLMESVVLSAMGGVAGLAVAYGGARAMIALAFPGARDLPVDPSPSLAVLGFATAVSLGTAFAVGLVPALIGSRADPIDAMRGAGRVAGDRGSRFRQTLVSLQVAMSLALVVCAGLLATSLSNLQRQDFGFRTEGRYAAAVSTSLGAVSFDHLETIYRLLPERLGRIPGVTSVGFSLYGPMEGNNRIARITADGHGSSERLSSSWNRVSPRYFETIGTRLVRGRFPDARDTPGAPAIAVISEAFAARFFGATDPIGQRFGFADRNGGGTRAFDIVGVVGDAKYQDPRGPAYATFFLPFLQQPPGLPDAQQRGALESNIVRSIQLRTDRPVPGLDAEVRRALADVDPGFTLLAVTALDDQVIGNFRTDRLIVTLATGFGAMALLLACLGLYGVTSQAVTARTREIGVRMAIGATPGRVVATVLRGTLLQIAIGFAVGAAAALAVGRVLSQLLFGVSGHDPRILGVSAVILALCAATAAAIPAARASRIDPIRALRIE